MSKSLTEKSRLSYLDGFRGLACLMVFFYHYDLNFGLRRFVIWGFTGVHLFFVLSGLLLSQPFLKAMIAETPFPALSPYYVRRFVRIYPPYLLSLLLYTGIRYGSHVNVPSVSNLLAHALLLSNYIDAKLWYSINPVYWSLSIEMQFYIVLPLICYAFYRLPFRSGELRCLSCVAAFAAIGVLARCLEFIHWHAPGIDGTTVMFRSVFSYLDLFAIGMLAALGKQPEFANHLRCRLSRRSLLVSGTAVLVLANLWCSFKNEGRWLETNSFGFCAAFPTLVCFGWMLLILANLLYEEKSFRFFNRGFFPWVGLISYTVYLYHLGVQFFYLKYVHLGSHVTQWDLRNLLDSLASLPLVLGVSVLLYQAAEVPCLRWLDRHRMSATVLRKSTATPASEV